MDPKRIREWCKQKEELSKLKKEGKPIRKRMKGAGRKASNEELEDKLLEWIVDLRCRNLRDGFAFNDNPSSSFLVIFNIIQSKQRLVR